jgi:hypothetical protein
LARRTAHADALHQAGRRAEAETRFRETERMQAERQPDYPLLYGLAGFEYCDLLLAAPERAAALASTADDATLSKAPSPLRSAGAVQSCRAVSQRATQTLKWVTDAKLSLLTVALNHLTLGRAALYEAILERSAAFTPLQRLNETAAPNDDERRSDLKVALQTARRELDAAVDGLRRAGQQQYLPLGLLTRAWLRFLTDTRTGPESAQEDLDTAWEIAERGPMPLFLADIHLCRARLFGTRNAEFGARNPGTRSAECGVRNGAGKYPWESPRIDLAAAEKLINGCGYHRRDEELADAKKAILGA